MKTKNTFPPLLPLPHPFSQAQIAVWSLNSSNWCFGILYYDLRSLMSSSSFSLCVGPGSPKELRWEQFQWLSLPSFQWKGCADDGGWYGQWKQEECQSCQIEGFPPSDNPDKPRINTVPAHGQNISVKVEKSESWLIEELKSVLWYVFKCNYFNIAAAEATEQMPFMRYPCYWNTFALCVS